MAPSSSRILSLKSFSSTARSGMKKPAQLSQKRAIFARLFSGICNAPAS
jgi:hypothetical protein